MWQDSIVEEVRKIREVYVEQFGFDLGAIYKDLKEQEKKSERKIVSFPPKHIVPENDSSFARPKAA